ncbi:MAG TPA: GNAT family N-acetyltransferase [Thermoanaerobaculia bacterium]|nr:GNAT family N-acetyltransferase [Thermoanaerobaculia bacterium]
MIRLLGEEDAAAYTALRRQALLELPLAFSAAPETDRPFGQGQIIFGAFEPSLVGFVGVFRDRHRKTAHKMHVWGMYVAPHARGRGLGAALLDAAIAHARTIDGVSSVTLSVTDAAPAARRLYERAGFRVWGTEPDALRAEGSSVAQHHMELPL